MGRRGPLPRLGPQVRGVPPPLPAPAGGEPPAPNPAWPEWLQAEWWEAWASPIAATWGPAHVPALRRLFEVRGEVAALRAAVQALGADLVVEGASGQPRAHPLLDRLTKHEQLLAAMEDRFGLTPVAAVRLGVAVGEAALTWQQVADRQPPEPVQRPVEVPEADGTEPVDPADL